MSLTNFFPVQDMTDTVEERIIYPQPSHDEEKVVKKLLLHFP